MDGHRNRALAKAIKEAGGVAALARYITEHYDSITTQAISQWRQCPSDRVLQVEAATGGKVRREQLRPDLYPTDGHREAA